MKEQASEFTKSHASPSIHRNTFQKSVKVIDEDVS
jgi:hypothetical protein